ncbi:sigma factor-like helix-turn-helix DNA-binding protein [Paenibacillus antarcticus]|nr:sigma factor-like helix-turn-helix DNA-binding protein [Paenibacillus antarcticus]
MEFSYQEIADLLGVKVSNIKSGLFQARKQFQKRSRGDVE